MSDHAAPPDIASVEEAPLEPLRWVELDCDCRTATTTHAAAVPGGALVRATQWVEHGEAIHTGLALTFVPGVDVVQYGGCWALREKL